MKFIRLLRANIKSWVAKRVAKIKKHRFYRCYF